MHLFPRKLMETNGNMLEPGPKPLAATPRGSVEDLSEYTDADESISSAPTEFLAEFLSAVMLKDYESALKYCKLILQYEPDNSAAKEFYPLIVEKIHLMEEERESGGSSSDSENGNNAACIAAPSSSESDSDATTASYSSLEDEEADDNGNTTHLETPALAPPMTTGPEMAFQSTSSDSESPTEPISQQNIAQLRAMVVSTRAK